MLKRDAPKYIRDLAKKDYVKGSYCEICGTVDELELHHYHTVSRMVYRWMTLNRITDDTLLERRQEFIDLHRKELYYDVATLCKTHHRALHKIYGKDPSLGTAEKQKNWVNLQHAKISV